MYFLSESPLVIIKTHECDLWRFKSLLCLFVIVNACSQKLKRSHWLLFSSLLINWPINVTLTDTTVNLAFLNFRMWDLWAVWWQQTGKSIVLRHAHAQNYVNDGNISLLPHSVHISLHITKHIQMPISIIVVCVVPNVVYLLPCLCLFVIHQWICNEPPYSNFNNQSHSINRLARAQFHRAA